MLYTMVQYIGTSGWDLAQSDPSKTLAVYGTVVASFSMRECLPGACPARYLCIKYPGSSPKFILT